MSERVFISDPAERHQAIIAVWMAYRILDGADDELLVAAGTSRTQLKALIGEMEARLMPRCFALDVRLAVQDLERRLAHTASTEGRPS